MQLHIDSSRCQGHNRCAVIAPTLVVIDDLGMASPAGDGMVPTDQEAAAKLAADNCPEYAISLTDD